MPFLSPSTIPLLAKVGSSVAMGKFGILSANTHSHSFALHSKAAGISAFPADKASGDKKGSNDGEAEKKASQLLFGTQSVQKKKSATGLLKGLRKKNDDVVCFF